jgi:hypothetical protein
MNKFLNQLAEEAEAGNIKGISSPSKIYTYAFFNNSFYEQLIKTSYFPSLNPELSDDFDRNKTKDELEKEAFERVTNDPGLCVKSDFDLEEIKLITGFKYISLFEAALLIGHIVDHDPKLIVYSSPELFLDACLNKKIDPREPESCIPYSKLNTHPVLFNGEVFFIKGTPDLSWKLSLKEVAEFAIAIGYPEYLFDDLMNEAVDQPTEATNIDESSNNNATNWKSKKDREFLLRTIGGLSLLLIEKTQGEKFGTKSRPNKAAIYGAIGDILSNMDLCSDGQSKGRLDKVLNEAFEITMKE